MRKKSIEAQAPKKHVAPRSEDQLNDRLLSAAVEVFLERGFAAASVDEIAARAKASKITFYNHYGNKEALFEAVVLRQNVALMETLRAPMPDGMPIEKFLETVANRLYAAFLKKDTVKLVRVLHAEAERFPQLADVFDDSGPGRGAKLLAADLEKYMASGTLRRADSLLAAEHFLHLALGELTRRVLLGLRPPLSKAEIGKRIAAGTDAFLRAYADPARLVETL